MQTVKAFGAKLFGSVFSNGVHDCLMRSLDEADRSDAGLDKRANDASEKRVASVERQRRLRPAHARRLSGGEHNGGNHEGIV